MGLFKLGFITILLSDSLVSGYTAAAAFTIMITQIKFLFGLPRALAAIPSGPFVTPKVSAIHTVGYSIAILWNAWHCMPLCQAHNNCYKMHIEWKRRVGKGRQIFWLYDHACCVL